MFGIRPAHLVRTDAVVRRILAEHGAEFKPDTDFPGPTFPGGASPEVRIGEDAYVLFRNVGPNDAAHRACSVPLKVGGASLIIAPLRIGLAIRLEVVGGAPPRLSPVQICAEVDDTEGVELVPALGRPGWFIAKTSADVQASPLMCCSSDPRQKRTLPLPPNIIQRLCNPAWNMSTCVGASVLGFSSAWEVADVTLVGPGFPSKGETTPAAEGVARVAQRATDLMNAALRLRPGGGPALAAATSATDSQARFTSGVHRATGTLGPRAPAPPPSLPLPPPPVDPNARRIVVTALHAATPPTELFALLSAAGPLKLLALGRPTGRLQHRTAYAEFGSDFIALSAIREFQGMPWMGTPLVLERFARVDDGVAPSSLSGQPSSSFPPLSSGPYAFVDLAEMANRQNRRLLLTGFPPATTAASLLALVGRGGAAMPGRLSLGPIDVRYSDRTAYAEYRSAADADSALAALHGRTFFGGRIQVSHPQQENAQAASWPPAISGPFTTADLLLSREPPASAPAALPTGTIQPLKSPPPGPRSAVEVAQAYVNRSANSAVASSAAGLTRALPRSEERVLQHGDINHSPGSHHRAHSQLLASLLIDDRDGPTSSFAVSEASESSLGDQYPKVPVDDERCLFLGGLGRETTFRDLRNALQAFGAVDSISVSGWETRKAFIVFRSAEAVSLALRGDVYVRGIRSRPRPKSVLWTGPWPPQTAATQHLLSDKRTQDARRIHGIGGSGSELPALGTGERLEESHADAASGSAMHACTGMPLYPPAVDDSIGPSESARIAAVVPRDSPLHPDLAHGDVDSVAAAPSGSSPVALSPAAERSAVAPEGAVLVNPAASLTVGVTAVTSAGSKRPRSASLSQ